MSLFPINTLPQQSRMPTEDIYIYHYIEPQ